MIFNKSLILIEKGDIDEALSLIDEAIKINSNPKILTQKGICLLKQEKYEEANSIFNEILNLDKNNIKAYIGKGQALFGLNKITESIEEYNKALNIEPNNSFHPKEEKNFYKINYNIKKDIFIKNEIDNKNNNFSNIQNNKNIQMKESKEIDSI